MSWDTVQNASAVTEIVSTGFKLLGYSLVTVCSVIGADYIKGYRGKEWRLQKMIGQWRVVLSRLSEDQKRQIALESPHMLESTTITLDDLEQRLYMLSIRSRKSSIWSRLVGKHAAEARTIEHLLQKLDEDLQTTTESLFDGQEEIRDRDFHEFASPVKAPSTVPWSSETAVVVPPPCVIPQSRHQDANV